jgi:glutamate 5-kinase
MRYLVKIGSALISKQNAIDLHWLSRKVSEIAVLHNAGNEIIVVSSGAVAAGMETRGLTKRPTDPLALQLLSGQGQVKLIKYYKDLFMEKKIYIAQILLTHHNFTDDRETSTVSTIIDAYLKDGVIPIINENDMVNKEELEYERSFTDNDILASLVAINSAVDRVLILTDVDGLHRKDPKTNVKSEIISIIPEITPEIEEMAREGKSDLGLGGMASKLQAAKMVSERSVELIIANGNYNLSDILGGKVPSSRFPGK